MKNLLLEKAMQHEPKVLTRTINSDLIGLAIAWAKDEITYSQVLAALKGASVKGSSAYIGIARAFRQAIRNGQIVVKK